ncbi:MAG: DegT/DnrJ/EryC1/StrS family aminotransferase [Chloroflexi bacterium]|nr:DegT/DnrJ/EryC1/StrS family aminotransferase [Chloroflexota bacterium]
MEQPGSVATAYTASKQVVPFVDLAAQYASISGELEEASRKVLSSTDYILGREVEAFEDEFAAYCGATCGVGVDSGTSALELALRACNIGPGDEVITAANTFIATCLAIFYTGATPVLVDVDPETFTMDVGRVAQAITPRTAAIIPVHLYGQPADMDPILDLASRHGLRVIEDACQAHGARYKGRRAGSLGDAAAFSFYPAKNLGAYGDGGMVVTNDPRLADVVRTLRNYGQRAKYEHVVPGYNRRLDSLQAALLRVKLPYLDEWNAARREHAEMYRRALAHTAVTTPAQAEYADAVWHLYVIHCHDRAQVQAVLARAGIATMIHYPIPVHLQEANAQIGCVHGDLPITERLAHEILSLPMYAELSPRQIEHVTETLAQVTT